MNLITQEQAAEFLRYEPETGHLVWIKKASDKTVVGKRASHFDAIPLCFEHHRGGTGLHGLGTKGFARHYGFDEADLLADVRRQLDQGGVQCVS